jgi:maleylacetoacetate isomerase
VFSNEGVFSMKLYGFFRSSAAFRARIALNLKGLDYEYVPVDLLKGEASKPEYRDGLNPQGLVPTLEVDGLLIAQSLAICDYLDEIKPQPPLMPHDAAGCARVRSLALFVACDIHPLNNVRVLEYLTNQIGVSKDQRLAWYHHWIHEGFVALEKSLSRSPATGKFCHGDTPTLADVCLVPQVYNAYRYKVDMTPYPTLRRINETCLALPAFDKARPENQPDAVP